ncbi:MAG: YicC family protein [Betaproteobacteria bacterium]|nr:YicC family protein [Betaproteobacteria bacterium]
MKETAREPLRSMTGYAVETAQVPAGQVSLELRSVNSRFLDLSFRMGDDFRALEPALRERISARVKRGKMECRLNLSATRDTTLPAEPNAALLNQLAALAGAVRRILPESPPLTTAEVLRWPGMLGEDTPNPEALHAAALGLLDRTLAQFDASRAREGDKLRQIIRERLDAIRAQIAIIRPRTPEIVAAYREKLAARLAELMASPDQDRIHQEVALFAQKIDVDEELDRLGAHLDEVERVLSHGGAAGKRLDFLMQELNREANTLGSKSVAVELTRASVELKVLIEQMREQVQNIE